MKRIIVCLMIFYLVGCGIQNKELEEGNSKEIAQGFVEKFYDFDLEAYSRLRDLEVKITNDYGSTETNGEFDQGKFYDRAMKLRAAYCTTGFCELNTYCTKKLQDELTQGRVLYGTANRQLIHQVKITFNSFDFKRYEDHTKMIYEVKVNVTYVYDEKEFTQDALLTLTLEEESKGMYKVSDYEVIEDLRFRDL